VQNLDASKIAYLIRASEEKNETCSNIALQLGVTRRRVEQILAQHRKSGCAPVLKKPGRKSVPIAEEEMSAVLEAYSRYKTNALYLEQKIEDDEDIPINHNRIQRVLFMNSLSRTSRKKWIRRV
jgi:predicted transcriptional regulator